MKCCLLILFVFIFQYFQKKSLECSYVLEPLSFKFIPKYAAFVIDIGGCVCAHLHVYVHEREREKEWGGEREEGREKERSGVFITLQLKVNL